MTIYQREGDINPYVINDLPDARMPGAQTLFGMATNLLNLTLRKFAEAGVEVPKRQAVYMSPIAADAEQLTVVFSGWTPFPATQGPQVDESFRWVGDFSVVVIRPTPALPVKSANTPTVLVDKLSKAAMIASQDADVLMQVLMALGEYAAAAITTQSPMGGLQVVEMNVQVPIGGLG